MTNESALRNIKDEENASLLIMIQTYDEINLFRVSMTFKVNRKKMKFATYSNQRTLFLLRVKQNFF
jgi:hypothetical protein